MPRSSESDVRIPWTIVERSWGFAFPPDCRSFTDSYGAGASEDHLEILEPPPGTRGLSVTGIFRGP